MTASSVFALRVLRPHTVLPLMRSQAYPNRLPSRRALQVLSSSLRNVSTLYTEHRLVLRAVSRKRVLLDINYFRYSVQWLQASYRLQTWSRYRCIRSIQSQAWSFSPSIDTLFSSSMFKYSLSAQFWSKYVWKSSNSAHPRRSKSYHGKRIDTMFTCLSYRHPSSRISAAER